MVVTRLFPKVTKGTDLDSEIGVVCMDSVDKRVISLLEKGKPITAWEVIANLGGSHVERISAILDGLTAEGVLARFRAGLNNYYALPRVALTGEEHTPKAAISDSLKSLFLSCQDKMLRHLKWQR